MKKGFRLTVIMIALLLFLSACGEDKYEPQAINEDTDICVICKMAIKDDQYATQIITKDGQSLKFDDIGCLNTWKNENGTDTIGAAFVRDYNTKQWLRYEKAYYAYDSSYKTPMAYGIVSFEQEADASAFIKEQGKGKLMTAEELSNHSWEVNRDMMDMGGEHEHEHGHSSEEGHGESESKHAPDEEKGHSSGADHPTTGGHGS
ncbi:nitrous oxide reductase accessory protein NosL [Paenibacillus solani]|uniref:nitrous oxide reductase accessory protein NosL n=1 Tax=Paenibacillus solani TaxID=1705565 RepID=UPI003D2AD42C